MSVTVDRIPGSSSITRMGWSIMGSTFLFCAVPRDGAHQGHGISGVAPSGAVPWGRDRQSHMECAAGGGRACRPDAPAMLLGNAPADEQAQAHPGEAPVVYVRTAMEALENMRQVFHGNTNARVADGEIVIAVLPTELDLHGAAFGTVLDGVLHQVLYQLHNAHRVVDAVQGTRGVHDTWMARGCMPGAD